MFVQWGCIKKDKNLIATTTLYAELELQAGLTPFKGHYFTFKTQNSLESFLDDLGYSLDEVKIQGQSAILYANASISWGFVQEAQILQGSLTGSQIFFATDAQSISNTSRLLLLPFDLVLNDYFSNESTNDLVLKIVSYQTNTQSFRVKMEIQLNILLNN